MRNCWLHLFWQSFTCFILFLPVYSQTVTTYTPYQALPTAPLPAINGSGSFIWPVTVSVQYFSVGSVMNISWTTKFSRVNLWAVPNFDWNSPTGLISNTPATYFEWTVDCGKKCSVPWLIRAVDAAGDQNEQSNGGFVSAEFWIGTGDSASSSTNLASTSASSTTSTRSTALTTSASSTTSTASSVLPTSSSASMSNSSSHSTISPALQSNSSSSQPVDTSNNVWIGVGVGVGIGIAAIAIGWFFLWRHYRRKRSQPVVPNEQHYPKYDHRTLTSFSRESSTKSNGRLELAVPSPKYFEAPGRNQDPQELYAEIPMQYLSRPGHGFAKRGG